jgi:antitoxin ParD1/3/4
MAKTTSIFLGDYLESFVNRQIVSGRYASANEVICVSLRLLEQYDQRIDDLRQALIEGEDSRDAGELDVHEIRRKARCRKKPGT